MRLIKSPIKKYQIVFACLSILCMAVIFLFSSENGDASSDTSGFFTNIIAKSFVDNYDAMTTSEQADITSVIDHIVRKAAHFSIYAALGLCVSFTVGRRRFFSAGTAAALLICFCYACTDELHQLFVPDRNCHFTDVLIDTCGSLVGISISVLCMKLHKSGTTQKTS
ncbi:MAG: VanZ family protein [Ruminococcus sp.]|nr:VanZ family protein [Ruminococcus sp.]